MFPLIPQHFVCDILKEGVNFDTPPFAMSDFSLILVLQIKTSVNRNKTWQRYK